jgi:hypothetical protein
VLAGEEFLMDHVIDQILQAVTYVLTGTHGDGKTLFNVGL